MGCCSKSSPSAEYIATNKSNRRNQTTTTKDSQNASTSTRLNPVSAYHARCATDGPPNKPKNPPGPASNDKKESSLYARTEKPFMPHSTFHENCCSESQTSATKPSTPNARNRVQSPSRTRPCPTPANSCPDAKPAKRPNKRPKKPAKPTCSDAHEHFPTYTPPSDSKGPGKIITVPTVNLKKFCSDFLRAHNAYRKLHGVKPLSLNKKVTADAQCWADTLASNDNMSPNPERCYGENIYSCSGFEPTGHHIVSAWYAEHADHYDFAHPVFSVDAAHFTNIIWRQTRQLGAGIARSNNGNYYVVAFYQPPGNVLGNFERNVPPPKTRAPGKQPVHPPYAGGGCCSCCCNGFNQFQKQGLEEHNLFRSRHYAPPLRLNKSLCVSAQKWAEQLAATNEVAYMGRAPFGQNVHCLPGKAATAEGQPIMCDDRALTKWYAEREQYDGRLTAATVHFSQLVWRSSADLGMGVARSRTGDVYTVAHYFPPGNIDGAAMQNVKHWKCTQ